MKETKKEKKKGILSKFKENVVKNKSILLLLGFVFSLLIVPVILFLVFFNNRSFDKPFYNRPKVCMGCNNEGCPTKRDEECGCEKSKTNGCPYRR